MTDAPTPHQPHRNRLLWAAAAGVVLLALVLWLVLRGGGSGDDQAATTASGSPSASAGASVTLGADGSPLPSKKPGQTEPTETVAPGKLPKAKRVALDDPAAVGDGVTVQVSKIEAVQGKGRGAGETSGPSLRFTIAVDNGSDADLDMIASVLTAYYGPDDTPASDLGAPGVRDLPPTIAAGKTGTGTFVFNIPVDQRDELRLDFSFSTEVPKVIFTGSA